MTAATSAPTRGWLFGALPDALLGCGVAYLIAAAIHAGIGADVARWVPSGLLILVFALPHYGATLLRVYESAGDRAKYRFFAVHATIALAIALAAGSHNALFGSLLLTVYLTWSPWHYTGQNYGIALMMLARRGIAVVPRTKRLLYASFVASYALTFVAIHGANPAGSYAPVETGGALYRMLPLGIPSALADPLLAATAAAYAALLIAAGASLVRAGRAAALAPAALVVATQAMWFSVPVLLRLAGVVEAAPGPGNPFSAYGFVWVAAAHSAQYLWITTYYATASGARSRSSFLARSALAGFAVWTLPGLVFAPAVLGGVTYDSGLALLVASCVNLHHFILDGAIWKLRDGAIARVLLRPRDVASAAAPEAERSASWLRPALAAAGAASIAIALFAFAESEFGFHRALERGDIARAEASLDRFAWIGRDGAAKRTEVGRALAARGELDRARVHFERSIEVEPTYRAQLMLGLVHEQQQDAAAALEAFDAALALEPGAHDALVHRGLALVELGRASEAIGDLEAATLRSPRDPIARRALVRAKLALEPPAADPNASDETDPDVGASALP